MQPLIWITVGYITGFIWGLYLKINIVPIVFLLIVGAILFLKRKKKIPKYQKEFYLFLIFMIISNLQIISLENKFNTLYVELQEIEVQGIVIGEGKKGEYTNSYIIKVENINKNAKYKNTNLLIYTKQNLECGKRVIFKRGI